jgi:multiple antibiotic resistance protein
MNTFVNAFLLTYAALFPIINPVGNAPLLLGLTRRYSEAERRRVVRGIAIYSFFLLLGSLVIGSHVLEFFGLSLPIVRIGGGIVVAAFGWELLNSGHSADDRAAAASPSPRAALDAFYPLTMPMTVGPGAMSVAVAIGSQRPTGLELSQILAQEGAAILGILAVSITIYLCYRYGEGLVAKLGASGSNVVIRLSAFLLFCIGIQIIWHGWQGLAPLH